MRKIAVLILPLILSSAIVVAQEEPEEQPVKKGGLNPCLTSVCIGPRVGLEMNEGKKIETSEWIGFLGGFVGGYVHPSVSALAQAYMAYDTGGKKNGMTGFAASYCIGPRVGAQLHERKIRTNEWLRFCGIGTCLIGWEAYQGKTMTDIEVAEGLRKS